MTKKSHPPRSRWQTSLSLEQLEDWNFDGSSTGQASGELSEVMIKPRVIYTDPFRGPPHVLVLCDNYTPNGEPSRQIVESHAPLRAPNKKDNTDFSLVLTNTRHLAKLVFDAAKEEEPWFGIEQEYVMFRKGTPLGWPQSETSQAGVNGVDAPWVQIGYPGPQGPFYCSVGADVAFGREVVEMHRQMCLRAGLQIAGNNGEVMCGQWEFQVGPCLGIDAGDQLTVARYILNRVGEKYGVVISYEPKPILGFNGSGGHVNFSTKKFREPGKDALHKHIIPAIERLGQRHAEHIYNYGSNNDKRLTGAYETASIYQFSWGVANRKASVRVGHETFDKKCGYFEDRRPAANMDPYVVTGMIFDTCILHGKFASASSSFFALRACVCVP